MHNNYVPAFIKLFYLNKMWLVLNKMWRFKQNVTFFYYETILLKSLQDINTNK